MGTYRTSADSHASPCSAASHPFIRGFFVSRIFGEVASVFGLFLSGGAMVVFSKILTPCV